MEKMKTEKLNSGSIVLSQGILLLFFLLFISFLFYFILTSFSLEGLFLLTFIIVIGVIVLKDSFSRADIFFLGDHFLLKSLFGTKTKSIKEYKNIVPGVFPFTYYIEFEDGMKLAFFLSNALLFQDMISLDSEKVVKDLREKFSSLKENAKETSI